MGPTLFLRFSVADVTKEGTVGLLTWLVLVSLATYFFATYMLHDANDPPRNPPLP